MQSAVCGVQQPGCTLHPAVYAVDAGVSALQYAFCAVLPAVCTLQLGVCAVQMGRCMVHLAGVNLSQVEVIDARWQAAEITFASGTTLMVSETMEAILRPAEHRRRPKSPGAAK